MGRAHYRGKRPADDEPIEGNMSAMQRAVTGLYTKRGTYQSCQRDSKGQKRKLGRNPSSVLPVWRIISMLHGCGRTSVTYRRIRHQGVMAKLWTTSNRSS